MNKNLPLIKTDLHDFEARMVLQLSKVIHPMMEQLKDIKETISNVAHVTDTALELGITFQNEVNKLQMTEM